MKIGFIGLGKMGSRMVMNLNDHKIDVVAYNKSIEVCRPFSKLGMETACSIEELASKLPEKKIIWLMVTAGKPVDSVIGKLLTYLKKDDIVIDGGNSFYKDSIRRYKFLKSKRIHFLDIGTSGGLEGARHGACLTIGGDFNIFKKVELLCRAVAMKNGYAYVGKAGAGHFVKMVHNGIEYALLQSYGEGFEMLFKSPYNLDLRKIAATWKNGSIIRSRILEWAEEAFRKDSRLNKIQGIVGGGETGQWAVKTAKELKVKVDSIKLALNERKNSKKHPRFAGKVVSAIRNEFGGHEIVKNR